MNEKKLSEEEWDIYYGPRKSKRWIYYVIVAVVIFAIGVFLIYGTYNPIRSTVRYELDHRFVIQMNLWGTPLKGFTFTNDFHKWDKGISGIGFLDSDGLRHGKWSAYDWERNQSLTVWYWHNEQVSLIQWHQLKKME